MLKRLPIRERHLLFSTEVALQKLRQFSLLASIRTRLLQLRVEPRECVPLAPGIFCSSIQPRSLPKGLVDYFEKSNRRCIFAAKFR
jgi:hypothetical protein